MKNAMKAIVHLEYGGPEVLRQVEAEKPAPADAEILVNVHAAALNPLDWHLMRGTPYLMRLAAGFGKPKANRVGVDYAGTVAAIGRSVTRFKVGDAVFGGATGTLAEYVAVPADGSVVLKPENLTFEQAAAATVAGVTALQALRGKAQVRRGLRILINGGSGGVGTFAVQLAKAFGAEVTAVQSARNAEMVRALGADRAIDYATEDFTKGAERHDVILDNVGNRSLSELRRVLEAGGKYLLIGAGGPQDHRWIGPFGRILHMLVLSRFARQDIGFMLARPNREDLEMLADLMRAGTVTPVVDRCYAFNEVIEAMRYLESGRARGKIVVTMPPEAVVAIGREPGAAH